MEKQNTRSWWHKLRRVPRVCSGPSGSVRPVLWACKQVGSSQSLRNLKASLSDIRVLNIRVLKEERMPQPLRGIVCSSSYLMSLTTALQADYCMGQSLGTPVMHNVYSTISHWLPCLWPLSFLWELSIFRKFYAWLDD